MREERLRVVNYDAFSRKQAEYVVDAAIAKAEIVHLQQPLAVRRLREFHAQAFVEFTPFDWNAGHDERLEHAPADVPGHPDH